MSSLADRPPPSTAAIAFATAIVAGVTGYFIGQAASLGIFGSSLSSEHTPLEHTRQGDSKPEQQEESEEDSEEDEEEIGQEQVDLKSFADSDEECKLVLVVRSDLGMSRGKIAAQTSHATLACYKALLFSSTSTSTNLPPHNSILRRWERQGQAKIAVQCKSEEELEMLQAQAMSMGVCAQVVRDAGRTQIAAGSATVLGVGPAPKGVVDAVTGGLKLL